MWMFSVMPLNENNNQENEKQITEREQEMNEWDYWSQFNVADNLDDGITVMFVLNTT